MDVDHIDTVIQTLGNESDVLQWNGTWTDAAWIWMNHTATVAPAVWQSATENPYLQMIWLSTWISLGACIGFIVLTGSCPCGDCLGRRRRSRRKNFSFRYKRRVWRLWYRQSGGCSWRFCCRCCCSCCCCCGRCCRPSPDPEVVLLPLPNRKGRNVTLATEHQVQPADFEQPVLQQPTKQMDATLNLRSKAYKSRIRSRSKSRSRRSHSKRS